MTDYSRVEPGATGNHMRKARFDYTDGYVGISLLNGDGFDSDRVLLSPKQWEALKAFVAKRHPRSVR